MSAMARCEKCGCKVVPSSRRFCGAMACESKVAAVRCASGHLLVDGKEVLRVPPGGYPKCCAAVVESLEA